MKLEYLSYITAIHQGRSLSKAAKILHTTPQNVSRVLKVLEDETNLSLFNRNTQGISLTTAGEDALHFAVNTLDEYNSFLKRHQSPLEKQNLTKGKLTIATFPAAGIPYLNDLILKFNQIHPNISVSAIEMDLKTSFQYFLEHDDIIAALPLQNLPNISHLKKQFFWQPIVQSQLAIIVSKYSPLSMHSSLPLSKLCKEPLTFICKSPHHSEPYKESAFYIVLQMHQLESSLIHTPFCTSNIDQYYQAIIKNGYVSLIDQLTFSSINPNYQKKLALIPLKDENTEIFHGLAIHKKNHLSEASNIFFQFCKAYATDNNVH